MRTCLLRHTAVDGFASRPIPELEPNLFFLNTNSQADISSPWRRPPAASMQNFKNQPLTEDEWLYPHPLLPLTFSIRALSMYSIYVNTAAAVLVDPYSLDGIAFTRYLEHDRKTK